MLSRRFTAAPLAGLAAAGLAAGCLPAASPPLAPLAPAPTSAAAATAATATTSTPTPVPVTAGVLTAQESLTNALTAANIATKFATATYLLPNNAATVSFSFAGTAGQTYTVTVVAGDTSVQPSVAVSAGGALLASQAGEPGTANRTSLTFLCPNTSPINVGVGATTPPAAGLALTYTVTAN